MDDRLKELMEVAKQHAEDLRRLRRENARLRAEMARLVQEGRPTARANRRAKRA